MTGVAEDAGTDSGAHDADDFSEHRDRLAAQALEALAELGYARASRRAIADHSNISYEELTKYFADKVDLMTHCVMIYKAHCIHRYDDVVNYAAGPRDFESGFAAAMAVTLRDEAGMHRLWYDLRSQSMFERSFSSAVDEIDLSLENMIWRVVTRYASLRGTNPVVPSPMGYALFDGLFHQALLRYLDGDECAPEALACDVADLLILIVPLNP